MVSTVTEIERKYDVPDSFAVPELAPGLESVVARVTGPVRVDLDATYYDTDGLHLAQRGITLRRREGGDDQGWHLKRSDGDGKTETREALTDDTAVPASLMREIHSIAHGSPLGPVVRIRTRRDETTLWDDDGQPLAVIADDTVTADRIVHGPAATTWREGEVELVNGTLDLLDAVEEILISAGARPATAPSKLARALGEYAPDQGHNDQGAPTDAGTLIIRYLKTQRDAIIGHEPLVRAGDVDSVHDMRVASRRARATLHTYGRFLPPDRIGTLDDDLHWIAGHLGAVRDLQMVRTRLRQAVHKLPPELVLGPVAGRINERLAGEEATAAEELATALGSDRFLALMSTLDSLLDASISHVSVTVLRRRARQALRRADRRLDQAKAAPGDTSSSEPGRPAAGNRDAALHSARRAYKRARYAVEVLVPALGRPANRLAERLGDLQDVLGAHQDAVVAGRLMRDFGVRARLDGDNGFTYGLLFASQNAAATDALNNLDGSARKALKPRLRRTVLAR